MRSIKRKERTVDSDGEISSESECARADAEDLMKFDSQCDKLRAKVKSIKYVLGNCQLCVDDIRIDMTQVISDLEAVQFPIDEQRSADSMLQKLTTSCNALNGLSAMLHGQDAVLAGSCERIQTCKNQAPQIEDPTGWRQRHELCERMQ